MDQHVTQPGGEPNLFQPDEVVVPTAASAAAVGAVQAPLEMPAPLQTTPQESASAQSPTVPSVPLAPTPSSFSWTAAEYLEHRKSFSWFAALTLVAFLLGAGVWFITKDVFLSSMVVLGVAVFGIYAGRRPKQTTYRIEGPALHIGSRLYDLREFRSFSVIPEGPVVSVELVPMKRFAIYTIFYCTVKDADTIADLLSAYLPITPPRNDLTDQFMRRIHF